MTGLGSDLTPMPVSWIRSSSVPSISPTKSNLSRLATILSSDRRPGEVVPDGTLWIEDGVPGWATAPTPPSS